MLLFILMHKTQSQVTVKVPDVTSIATIGTFEATRFCDFLSLHSLGTSNVFVSSSSQNTVYVSLLCVTLFDTVLYCLACHLLSCINFVTVAVTDGQQERVNSGWFSGGRGRFFSNAETEMKSLILFHTLSVGCVVVLCSRKHFQICYSISKCFVSV